MGANLGLNWSEMVKVEKLVYLNKIGHLGFWIVRFPVG